KHILPNAMGVIIVAVTLLMSSAILLETALSYLGFGIFPPNVSLGTMISQYQGAFNTRPWLFWWPGLFIIIIALSVNFIGDGLRDAFDPGRSDSPRSGRCAERTRGPSRPSGRRRDDDGPRTTPVPTPAAGRSPRHRPQKQD